MILVQEIIDRFRLELSVLYDAPELDQVTFLVLESVLGYKKTDMVLKRNELLNPAEADQLFILLSELKTGKPVQYCLGHTWFCDLKFIVNEHVLIPRPETEELVHIILKEYDSLHATSHSPDKPLRVLDIGTGSGCIAISLKKKCPAWKISGLDISDAALGISRRNAKTNNVEVDFFNADILHWKDEAVINQLQKEKDKCLKWDLIVSNPPYVLATEEKVMHVRVKNFEPHKALFVPDEDPLLFYKNIADFAKSFLSPGAKIFFEINESKSDVVVSLLEENGFGRVESLKDLHGKARVVKAILK